jgi:hypothetical protein
MDHYLESSEFIDWKHPAVPATAAEFARDGGNDEALAKRCVEFFRDAIRHSGS